MGSRHARRGRVKWTDLALRELIGLHATIYAVDKDQRALNDMVKAHRAEFGTSQNVHIMRADFTGTLSLPPLDGIRFVTADT